ncbi:hypothetical protein DQ04_03921050 [Trypanosoma grayi]|uniref:hypothetical protein n=1 Tax=Trypanosoma grayi TaxID=71804 RepID=UPI0004F42EC8|nr:hypothetical protein DQ04_03921050 [Trypanosoma grayi]KEG10295.1 hypothetical protein DQ04_03921050 [Trypanosoma grayi]
MTLLLDFCKGIWRLVLLWLPSKAHNMANLESMLPTGLSLPPLVLVVLYLAAIVFSWVNYAVIFRVNIDLFGRDLVGAYLAFCIVGTVVVLFISSVVWLRAARYTAKQSQRVRLVLYGVCAVFFFKDLPLFVAESISSARYGWQNGYQGFCFVVQFCFFLLALIATWLAFTWLATNFLECHWGERYNHACGLPGNALSHPAAIVITATPPPMMLQEARDNQDGNPSFLVKVNAPYRASYAGDFRLSGAPLDQWKNSNGYI